VTTSAESTERFFGRRLRQRPAMAILRGHGPARTLDLCARAWAAGIELVEIPVQTEDDWASLSDAIDAGRDQGKLVGAGTVVSPKQVRRLADLGAGFTVSPGFDEEVLAASSAAGLPHLPGVATATEVHHATRAGLRWLKAFPASVLGPGWFAAMRGPFPDVCLVATGGVDVDNASGFLDAGAAAVSLGTAFADADPRQLAALVGRR
jgi:2-dehydro-3-deoxyphosphogluconate aldolase / (4S)-4-hydroxy-2-oxoglutarate aldolase